MPDPPPGFITRIAVDRVAGVGPWAAEPTAAAPAWRSGADALALRVVERVLADLGADRLAEDLDVEPGARRGVSSAGSQA